MSCEGCGPTVDNRVGAKKAEEEVHYSESMRARMTKRMTGPNAMSANALSQEVGIPQGQVPIFV
jgi:hypothetical protein